MTGPSIPFFQPPVSPSWTFQDPGDVGAMGSALGGLVESMQKQQILQMQQEQNQMQHEQLQGAIQARQMQHQAQLEELKIRKIQEQETAKQAQHLRDLKMFDLQNKDSAGKGAKDAMIGKATAGVADANVPTDSLMTDFLPMLQGLLGGDLSGGQNEMPNSGVVDYLKAAKDAGIGVNPPASEMPWTVGNDTLYRKDTGEVGGPIGIQGSKAAGANGANGEGGDRKQLAGQDKRMGESMDAAVKTIQAIPAAIQAARGAARVQSGALTPLKQSFGKWMVATGLATPEQMKDTQKNEEYMMTAVRNSLGLLASGTYGTGNSITEQDRRAAEKLSGADLSLEPRTIKLTQRFALLSQAQSLEQFKAKLDALKARPYKGWSAADIEAEYGSGVGGSEGLQRQIDLLRKEAEKVMPMAEVEAIGNGTTVTGSQFLKNKRGQ